MCFCMTYLHRLACMSAMYSVNVACPCCAIIRCDSCHWGCHFFPLMWDVLSMVYCKMKTHTEKEGETKQELCRHLQGTASKHLREKGITLTILHEAGTRLWMGTAREEIWGWQRWRKEKEERRDTVEGRKNGGSSRCRDVSYPTT